MLSVCVRAAIRVPMRACVRRLRASAVLRRNFATGEFTSLSEEQNEQLKRVQEQLRQKIERDTAELKEKYGAEHAEKMWMYDYYKHKHHQYLPAALNLLSNDPRAKLPTAASKLAVFTSHILTQHPEQFQMYAAVLPLMVPDVSFLLSVFKQVDTTAGKSAFQRLANAVRKGGDEASMESAAHLSQTPTVNVLQWPVPFLEPDFVTTYKNRVLPYEVHGSFPHAKEQLNAQEYCLLASSTVLESLWAGFYATGEAGYIRRVLGIAEHWASFTHLPDYTDYCISIEKRLPDDIMKPANDESAIIRSVTAQVSRAASWSLLAHSRRHPVVVETLADELKALSQHFLEASAREEGKAAAVPSAVARRRLELYPSLLALMARMSLESSAE